MRTRASIRARIRPGTSSMVRIRTSTGIRTQMGLRPGMGMGSGLGPEQGQDQASIRLAVEWGWGPPLGSAPEWGPGLGWEWWLGWG